MAKGKGKNKGKARAKNSPKAVQTYSVNTTQLVNDDTSLRDVSDAEFHDISSDSKVKFLGPTYKNDKSEPHVTPQAIREFQDRMVESMRISHRELMRYMRDLVEEKFEHMYNSQRELAAETAATCLEKPLDGIISAVCQGVQVAHENILHVLTPLAQDVKEITPALVTALDDAKFVQNATLEKFCHEVQATVDSQGNITAGNLKHAMGTVNNKITTECTIVKEVTQFSRDNSNRRSEQNRFWSN